VRWTMTEERKELQSRKANDGPLVDDWPASLFAGRRCVGSLAGRWGSQWVLTVGDSSVTRCQVGQSMGVDSG